MKYSTLKPRFFSRGLRAWRIWLLGVLIVGNGCSYLPRETKNPIPTTAPPGNGAQHSTLVVFLPGRRDGMEDFTERGMADEMARAGVRADWVAVDAHPGYYRDRSIVERLKADVIGPARVRGYSRIVVVGVSMGGLGGLLCERDTLGLIDGLVLVAPYLGHDKKLFAEIEAEGGPAVWAQTRERVDDPVDEKLSEQVWVFIGSNHARLPPTWLAYGTGDWLGGGHRLLAPLLPVDRVKTVEGGHHWKIWQGLWRELCVNSDLFLAERVNGSFAQGVASDSIILRQPE